MSIFTGAGVALVTPTYADGSVNFDKLKELTFSGSGQRFHVHFLLQPKLH